MYSKRGGLQGSSGVGDAIGEVVGGPWGQAAAVGTVVLHMPVAPTPATFNNPHCYLVQTALIR